MSPDLKTLIAEIRRLADAAQQRIEKLLNEAIARWQKTLTDEQILGIVRAVQQEFGLTARFDLSKPAQALESVVREAIAATAQTVPVRPVVRFRFDATSPETIAFAQQFSGRFIREINDETRKGIRAAVVRSAQGQLTPRQLASVIRPMLGLTARQVQAVARRRAALFQAGVKDIDKRIERYAAKLLRQRAQTIARTETIAAATEGQLAAWKAAQQRGLLDSSARKVWIVTPDDRLCPVCRPLDGQRVPLSAAFVTANGAVFGPPAHPNCRCAVGLAVERVAVRRIA